MPDTILSLPLIGPPLPQGSAGHSAVHAAAQAVRDRIAARQGAKDASTRVTPFFLRPAHTGQATDGRRWRGLYRPLRDLLALGLIATACHSSSSMVVAPAKPDIVPTAKAVTETAQAIRTDAAAITTAAGAWQAKAPAEPEHTAVVTHATAITTQTARLDEAGVTLVAAQAQTDQRDEAQVKSVTALEAEVKRLQNEAASRQAWLWRSFQAAGASGLVGAAVAAYFMPALGIPIFIAGAMALAIGTFMLSNFSWVLGLVIGGLILLGGAALGFSIWRKIKADKIVADAEKNKTLREADLVSHALDGSITLDTLIAGLRSHRPMLDAGVAAVRGKSEPGLPEPGEAVVVPSVVPGGAAPPNGGAK